MMPRYRYRQDKPILPLTLDCTMMQSQFIKAKCPLPLLFKLASASALTLAAVFAPLPSLADDIGGGPCNPGTPNPGDPGSVSNPLLPTGLVPPNTLTPPPFIIEFPINICAEQTIFIDPEIAIGYDYLVTGGPLFTSVLAPAGINANNRFDLYLPSIIPGEFTYKDHIFAGTPYPFETPQSLFRILGIDPSANLSVNNSIAFVTGVTFDRTVLTTDTPRPIVIQTPIPAPGPLPLLGVGAAWGWSRRLRNRIRLKRFTLAGASR
jgi:MYXO-CTERM domain-containing protein